MATSHERGWPTRFDAESGVWRYVDTGEVADGKRSCIRCGRAPLVTGEDACLGHVDGATSACCGHGVSAQILMMRELPQITVGCSVCGDDVEISEIGTNEDGSIWITISGVCSRETDSRVEEANHRAHMARIESERRIENERRESEHRLETERFMTCQREEKAEQYRRWDRMLGRR